MSELVRSGRVIRTCLILHRAALLPERSITAGELYADLQAIRRSDIETRKMFMNVGQIHRTAP